MQLKQKNKAVFNEPYKQGHGTKAVQQSHAAKVMQPKP
jgi:hypothetical protein